MKELTAYIDRYNRRLEAVARKAPAEVSSRVAQRTPVLTGQLRGSWNPAIGEPRARNVGPGGSSRSIAAVANSLQLGQVYSFANGQPYARRIEYEGWSAKAPSGMLRISTAEWSGIVEGFAGGN